jgi:two-component system, cell cycle response regulator DivK
MKSVLRPLVLLVEDHQDTRDLYCAYLSVKGFDVRTARNGIEGFSRACEELPDVVVTDILLPNIDGWELVRRLKADARTNGIPIVVLTGWVTDSPRETAERLGCASYLSKPCFPEVLVNEIHHVIADRPAVKRAV